MSNLPLVSIIINCHNGEKYLKECLDSVILQTYKNWEIIFWDTLSFDNSKNLIKNNSKLIIDTRGKLKADNKKIFRS